MIKKLLPLFTAATLQAGVVLSWDYEPGYLASGPFEDIAQVSYDLTNWTTIPRPYGTVTNHPAIESRTGMSYFIRVEEKGITNPAAFFRVYRWWTDTNAHPLTNP